jgi:hypothetical protein
MTPKIANKTRKTTTTKLTKVAAPAAAADGKDTVFAAGQKWQLDLGHAEIVHVGKFLIDYRFYKVATQKHVPVETKTLVDFAATLKKKKAKLVS